MAPYSMIPAGLVSLLFAAVRVSAHGIADAIAVYPQGAAGGTFYRGYNPSYQYEKPPPSVAAWSTPDDLQNTFVPPDKFAHNDIICHLGATPGELAVPVNGGDDIGIRWNTWPESHKGPVIDYLANCNGPCNNVDKSKLKWFAIGRQALLDSKADLWAPNVLIKNGFTWFTKIPTSIEPGNYVLRHEIIALHAAGQLNGAQNYPFCFNLAITTNGTDKPDGIIGTQLYKANSPGIQFDLFSRKDTYPIPGPELYSGALTASQRQPKITATGTAIKSFEIPAVQRSTSKSSSTSSSSSAVSTSSKSSTVKASSSSSSSSRAPSIVAPTVPIETALPPSIIPAPTIANPEVAPNVVTSTLIITERITVVKKETVTRYTTIQAPR